MQEPAPIPRSQAPHVYALLEDTCRVIEEEPKRYDQRYWGRSGKAAMRRQLIYDPPACFTIGCRGGWIFLLAGGDPRGIQDAGTIASTILGDNYYRLNGRDREDSWQFHQDVQELFSQESRTGLGPDEYWPYRGKTERGPEQAAMGIKGLRAFMEKWEKRLKETPVMTPQEVNAMIPQGLLQEREDDADG